MAFLSGINRQKLPHAAAFLWLMLSLLTGEFIYYAIDGGGFLMRLFSFALAAAPVWITYGWRWLTDNARFPLKASYSLIAVSLVLVAVFLYDVYDSYHPDESLAFYAFYTAAIGVFPWFFDGLPKMSILKIALPKRKKAQTDKKSKTGKEKGYLIFWGVIVPVTMYWLHAPPIMFFILAFFLFLAWWQKKAEDGSRVSPVTLAILLTLLTLSLIAAQLSTPNTTENMQHAGHIEYLDKNPDVADVRQSDNFDPARLVPVNPSMEGQKPWESYQLQSVQGNLEKTNAAFWDDKVFMEKQAQQVWDTLSATGVTGVSIALDECYENAESQSITRCIAFDAVASYIIPAIEKESHFPMTSKFEQSVYHSRVKAALGKINITAVSDQEKTVNALRHEAALALDAVLKADE